MAARRLVMILLLLLIVSTFAATLVPPPDEGAEETSTPATTAAGEEPRGRLVRRTVSAEAMPPERVEVRVGSALDLRVTARRFHEVEIPELGEYDEVDEFAPVVFELLVDEKGTYPVRIAQTGRVIARIVVSGCCRTS
jgi:hypothetical protein